MSKYDKSAIVEIAAVFGTLLHIDCPNFIFRNYEHRKTRLDKWLKSSTSEQSLTVNMLKGRK